MKLNIGFLIILIKSVFNNILYTFVNNAKPKTSHQRDNVSLLEQLIFSSPLYFPMKKKMIIENMDHKERLSNLYYCLL